MAQYRRLRPIRKSPAQGIQMTFSAPTGTLNWKSVAPMGFVVPGVWPVGVPKPVPEPLRYSADPIQPSGPLEPSIPCLSTVLRRGFVDANP